jgi:uncharacterized oligopeptide transporter (OPT) family protein
VESQPRPGEGGNARYREITVGAITFALIVGVIMNAAITYAGLKIGFTIGGSAVAAVLGFGILRGVFRRGSILEINIAQTVASAVNISNSGVIFTVPVLLLIGYTLTVGDTDFWMIMGACIAGAMLGTAFIIPLRKQMLDIERLRFPSATAVASILKSPGAGSAKAVVLVVGIAFGALIYFPTQLSVFGWPGLSELPGLGVANGGWVGDDRLDIGFLIGLPAQFHFVFAIAPFALGAGYLTGRPGLYVLAGGILAYLMLTPVAFELGWLPATVGADQAATYGFGAFNRPLGIGILLGGAIMGVVFSLPATKEAIKSIIAAGRLKAAGDELGMKTLVIAIILGFLFLFWAADYVGSKPVNQLCPITGEQISEVVPTVPLDGYEVGFSTPAAAAVWASWGVDRQHTYLTTEFNAKPGWLSGVNRHVRAALIALVGTLWIWFAGIIIAQATGMTDWSPISGMALLTVVLVLLMAGTGAVVPAVLIGAALCVAITLAADMMSDMKTGYLVGAIPRKQQITELSVVWIGPIVSLFTILLIAAANMEQFGVALGPETPTTAPQAQALQAVITGAQGGEMPYALYGFGAVVGALLGLGAFPGLGVLVGLSMYLPFLYIATYGVGCLVNIGLARYKGKVWAEAWGVPFCAGLIVGESVLALIINGYVLLAS